MIKTTKYTALLALVILTIIWASSWIVMKSVLAYVDPFDFTAARSLFAALLLLLILMLRNGRLSLPPLLPVCLIGLLQTLLYGATTQFALVTGGAGKTAILVFTMPFWTTLLAIVFLQEKLSRLQRIALILAALGLIAVLQPWNNSATLLSSVLAVVAGLFWAISNIIAKKLYTTQSVDPLALTAWQMLFGSILLVILALLVSDQHFIATPYVWFALGYNVILVTAVGWLLWLFILKSLPAGIAGLSILAIPVVGMLLSWWLLGEQLNNSELGGVILIISALTLLHSKTLFDKN